MPGAKEGFRWTKPLRGSLASQERPAGIGLCSFACAPWRVRLVDRRLLERSSASLRKGTPVSSAHGSERQGGRMTAIWEGLAPR
jgi:hypothetical protein